MTSQNTHVLRRALPYAAIVGSMLLGAPAWSQANKQPGPSPTDTINVPTMKDDLAQRSSDIHWPEGFDPMNADLFAHKLMSMRLANACGTGSLMPTNGRSGIRTRRMFESSATPTRTLKQTLCSVGRRSAFH
nr:hypothetical protein [Burkholderia sp. L27(2015)]